jgi:hypothetical protein
MEIDLMSEQAGGGGRLYWRSEGIGVGDFHTAMQFLLQRTYLAELATSRDRGFRLRIPGRYSEYGIIRDSCYFIKELVCIHF